MLDQCLYQLQAEVGSYSEIEGVAKWNREEKVTQKLNTKELFAQHPEMKTQFEVIREASVSYLVRNWREY